MKKVKSFVICFCLAVLAGVTAMNVNLRYKAAGDGELTLVNTEALAQGEGEGELCSGIGTVTCNGESIYRRRYFSR